MIKVSVEVRSGTARFSVAVRAESIERAVSLVGGRYSGSVVRVKVPTLTGDLFEKDRAAPAAMAGSRQPVAMSA